MMWEGRLWVVLFWGLSLYWYIDIYKLQRILFGELRYYGTKKYTEYKTNFNPNFGPFHPTSVQSGTSNIFNPKNSTEKSPEI